MLPKSVKPTRSILKQRGVQQRKKQRKSVDFTRDGKPTVFLRDEIHSTDVRKYGKNEKRLSVREVDTHKETEMLKQIHPDSRGNTSIKPKKGILKQRGVQQRKKQKKSVRFTRDGKPTVFLLDEMHREDCRKYKTCEKRLALIEVDTYKETEMRKKIHPDSQGNISYYQSRDPRSIHRVRLRQIQEYKERNAVADNAEEDAHGHYRPASDDGTCEDEDVAISDYEPDSVGCEEEDDVVIVDDQCASFSGAAEDDVTIVEDESAFS